MGEAEELHWQREVGRVHIGTCRLEDLIEERARGIFNPSGVPAAILTQLIGSGITPPV